jgi:dephospho-CoA kinase
VHLAVFVEPFLEYVLSGRKTVESRFSAVRFPPYRRVSRGDLVLLKASGGPVVGVCEVGAAWFYRLEPDSWKTIRREFAAALCAENPEFWRMRAQAEFATLMYVARVKRLPPVPWPKRDRRGWVVVRGANEGPLFGGCMKSTVLGFSGGIASGKSTLSEAVALSLGCPRVSFGGFMRAEAKRRGISTDREALQALGEELVARDPDGLCRSVLAQTGWIPGGPLVVDGIRHVAIADRVRKIACPSEFRLVHVDTDGVARGARFTARGEDFSRLAEFDAHSTERDVKRGLPEIADLVVDGNQSIESLIEQVDRWAEDLE